MNSVTIKATEAIVTSPIICTYCQICDSSIAVISTECKYPRICDECKKRLKKLLYESPKEE